MPTGYTSNIYEGENMSGADFIKRCARAFGAYVMVRDEPLDNEVPDRFEVSSWNKERLLESNKELQRYYTMSLEEAQKEADVQYEKKVKYNIEQIDKLKELKKRYQQTLDEVRRWSPPTKDHVNLKKYCIEQLETSINHDCDLSYYIEEVKHYSGQEWLDMSIASCLRDIEYHSKQQAEENKRVDERNEWIRQLKESLKDL